MARKKQIELSDSQRGVLEFLGGYDERRGDDHSQHEWHIGAIPVLDEDVADLEALAKLGLVDVTGEDDGRRWKINGAGLKETLDRKDGDPIMALAAQVDPDQGSE